MAYKLNMTGKELADQWSWIYDTINTHSNLFNDTMLFRGDNPITTSDQDTCNVWRQMPSGIYWFSNAGRPLGLSQYGYLIHISPRTHIQEIQQIFVTAPTGTQYFRGANAAGWSKDPQGLDACGNNAWTEVDQ